LEPKYDFPGKVVMETFEADERYYMMQISKLQIDWTPEFLHEWGFLTLIALFKIIKYYEPATRM